MRNASKTVASERPTFRPPALLARTHSGIRARVPSPIGPDATPIPIAGAEDAALRAALGAAGCDVLRAANGVLTVADLSAVLGVPLPSVLHALEVALAARAIVLR
jgi:hypothetical protein